MQDLCILLGCDYTDTIRGVGPKTALKLIREHGNIETILQKIDRKKYTVPDSWVPNEKKSDDEDDNDSVEEETPPPNAKTSEENDEQENGEEAVPAYVEARKLFNEHEVLTDVKLKWKPCQAAELTKFLVDEMGFNPDRVKANIEKLEKAYKATSKPQMRMDNFFAVKKPSPEEAAKRAAKRKAEKEAAKKKAKEAKKKKK